VWETLVNVSRWPEWNQEVKSVTVNGPLREGTVFRWKTNSGTITSTFQTIQPPHHVAWTGRTMGIKAVHAWRLEPNGTKTSVRTAESFDGLLAQLLRRPLRTMLTKTLDRGLESLKTAVEQQPRHPEGE